MSKGATETLIYHAVDHAFGHAVVHAVEHAVDHAIFIVYSLVFLRFYNKKMKTLIFHWFFNSFEPFQEILRAPKGQKASKPLIFQ